MLALEGITTGAHLGTVQDSAMVVVVTGGIPDVEEEATMEKKMTAVEETVASNSGTMAVAGKAVIMAAEGKTVTTA